MASWSTFKTYARDADGFPVPIGTLTVAPESGLPMTVPGEAVVMASSVDPEASPGGSGGAGGGAGSGAAGSGGIGGALAGGAGGTAPAAATPESEESACGCADARG